MGGSFCGQIGRTANAIYLRGPTLIGSETSAIANLAVAVAEWMNKQFGNRGLAVRLKP